MFCKLLHYSLTPSVLLNFNSPPGITKKTGKGNGIHLFFNLLMTRLVLWLRIKQFFSSFYIVATSLLLHFGVHITY